MNKKEELRQAFFKEHTEAGFDGLPKIATAPHDLFEWFYEQLSLGSVGNSLDLVELELKIDKALDNETSESLKEWIHNKRL